MSAKPFFFYVLTITNIAMGENFSIATHKFNILVEMMHINGSLNCIIGKLCASSCQRLHSLKFETFLPGLLLLLYFYINLLVSNKVFACQINIISIHWTLRHCFSCELQLLARQTKRDDSIKARPI
jgi:hypothetical protein